MEGEKGKKSGNKVKLKVVCRNLPPALNTVEAFLELLTSLEPQGAAEVDWSRLLPSSKRVPTSTGYLHFKTEDALLAVFAKLGGHKLLDSKGKQFQILVEYAPFQKVAKKKVIDKRDGTIDKDPDFKAFQEEFKTQSALKVESAEVWLERREAEQAAKEAAAKAREAAGEEAPPAVLHTPLLDFLREKRQKDGQERRRRKEDERRNKMEDDRQKRLSKATDAARRATSQGSGGQPPTAILSTNPRREGRDGGKRDPSKDQEDGGGQQRRDRRGPKDQSTSDHRPRSSQGGREWSNKDKSKEDGGERPERPQSSRGARGAASGGEASRGGSRAPRGGRGGSGTEIGNGHRGEATKEFQTNPGRGGQDHDPPQPAAGRGEGAGRGAAGGGKARGSARPMGVYRPKSMREKSDS